MLVRGSTVFVLLVGLLSLGGCAVPWWGGGGETPAGDTTVTPSEETSREPLVQPGERRTRADSPGFVQIEADGTAARIPPEDVRSPERARELAHRAYRAFEQGDTEHALSLFRRAARQDPQNVEILSNIGSLYFRRGNFRSAVEAYRKALDVDEEDYFSHFYAGVAYYRMGKRVRARHHFQRAAEIRPNRREPREWLKRLTSPDGTPDG